MESNDQLQAPTALPRGKFPRCSMYKKLRGFQFGSGGFGERKNLLAEPGIGQQVLA